MGILISVSYMESGELQNALVSGTDRKRVVETALALVQAEHRDYLRRALCPVVEDRVDAQFAMRGSSSMHVIPCTVVE